MKTQEKTAETHTHSVKCSRTQWNQVKTQWNPLTLSETQKNPMKPSKTQENAFHPVKSKEKKHYKEQDEPMYPSKTNWINLKKTFWKKKTR